MGDEDTVAPDAKESSSSTSFDQIVAEMQFFSDNGSNHDELDEIETITSDAGIIDLCSDSEPGDEDADCVEELGIDSAAAASDASNDVDREPAMESAREKARLSAKVLKILDRLDKLMRSPCRDCRLTGQQKTFINARKGEIREQTTILSKLSAGVKDGSTMTESALREAVEAKKQHVQALHDSVATMKLRYRMQTITNSECINAVCLAITAVKSMTALAGTEITVLDKWSVDSWALASRVNWSATRYPEAEPAIENTACVAWAWKQLTKPNTEKQRHRTVVRVDGVRKLPKGVALVKRIISIEPPAPASAQPARIIEDLSVVFIAWDFGSFYVGIASLPGSKSNTELEECQCWVFTPSESQFGTDAATTASRCGVQYAGFHTVHSAEVLDDAAMDVMAVLPHFDSHLEL